jgi:hypothetical protein
VDSDIIEARLTNITSIEAYDCYVVTVCDEYRIIITSAQDMLFVADFDIRSVISNIKDYRLVVLYGTLIIIYLTHNCEQGFAIKSINSDVFEIKEKKNIDLKELVSVEAYPVLLENCVYFAGYDGYVYRVNRDFKLSSLKISLPNVTTGTFSIRQVMMTTQNEIYLVAHTNSKTYIFRAKGESDFIKLREHSRLFVDDVCFFNGNIYLFESESNGQVSFSKVSVSYNDVESINRSFDDNTNICDYCIAESNGVEYLLYMEKSNSPRQIRTYREPLTGSGLGRTKLSSTNVCDNHQFLLYKNFMIICDHKDNKISVKDWTVL